MQQQMETELVRRVSENRIDSYYPDDGPLRRELYPKHLEFFRAGIEHRERCFLAANRVGKTEGVGGYELTCHLTGEYPDWWEGRTFDQPIEAWAAGDTSQTVRDIIQAKLLGPDWCIWDRLDSESADRSNHLPPRHSRRGARHLRQAQRRRHKLPDAQILRSEAIELPGYRQARDLAR